MRTLGESACDVKKARGWILDELAHYTGKQARELLVKWEHLLAHSNLDLSKTSMIKQLI